MKILIQFKQTMLREKKRYLLIFSLFLLGILIGSISSALSDNLNIEDARNSLNRVFTAYMMQGTQKSEAFRLSLFNQLSFAFWLWICGWHRFLLPVGMLQTALKGFRTGFTITYLCQCYQGKGILLTIFSILPSSLLMLPALCFYLACQIQFAKDRQAIQNRQMSGSRKRTIYLHHVITTFVFLVHLILIAILDGYLVPTILQPLCGYFL